MDMMTVKEVAEVLGYEKDYLRKKVKELFPETVKNGIETELTEEQVYKLKKNLTPRTLDMKIQGENAITSLDIEEMTIKVLQYHMAEAERLRVENARQSVQLAIAAPKVESFDAMQRADNTMSITQAAKHFGLHPKTEVFPYLRDCGYLTMKDLPTQAALDAGYLIQRQVRCPDGVFRPAACVMLSQLETWRVRVVPQIAAWKERNK